MTQHRGSTTTSLADSTIEVLLSERGNKLSQNLYGYLLENLGTVIYDGVWVGETSKIANIGGIRKALVDRMRAIGPSVIRWPGGNFADYYDWKDGVGPRSERPRRTNMWANYMPAEAPDGPQRYDPNAFGTPEFMQLCQLTSARPFLNANVRGLNPQNFDRWVEYCNAPARTTTLAELREADGSREPFGVRYWGIGNEVWGAGGAMTAEDYAAVYKRFTMNPPQYGYDLAFVACGGPPPNPDLEWIRTFLRICKAAWSPITISAISIHYYPTFFMEGMSPGLTVEECLPDGTTDWNTLMSDAIAFDADEWYDVLAKSARIGSVIEAHWSAMEEFDPAHKIKLSVDEWGAFYRTGTELNSSNIRGRAVTLRDAVAAALTLDVFHKHADKLLLANFTGLINQEGGLFLADGDKFVETPIYYTFLLYAAHSGGQLLRTIFNAPNITFKSKEASASLWGLNGSASLKGNEISLTVVNPHVKEPRETNVILQGGDIASAEATVLTSNDIHAQNTFTNPDSVLPSFARIDVQGSSFTYCFPPASITRLLLRMM